MGEVPPHAAAVHGVWVCAASTAAVQLGNMHVCHATVESSWLAVAAAVTGYVGDLRGDSTMIPSELGRTRLETMQH